MVEAIACNREFESRWVQFAGQAKEIIARVGSDRFLEHFDESNTDGPLLEKLNSMVSEYNAMVNRRKALRAPEHVKSFDPDPAAHGGALASGSTEGLEKNLPRVITLVPSVYDKDPARCKSFLVSYASFIYFVFI